MNKLVVIMWLLAPLNLAIWAFQKAKGWIAGGYSG